VNNNPRVKHIKQNVSCHPNANTRSINSPRANQQKYNAKQKVYSIPPIVGIQDRIHQSLAYPRDLVIIRRRRHAPHKAAPKATALARRSYRANLQGMAPRPRWLTRFLNGVAMTEVPVRIGTSRLGNVNVRLIAEFLVSKGPTETGRVLQLLLFWRPGVCRQVSNRIDANYTRLRGNITTRLRLDRSIIMTADGMIMS
jgi:hypothetical protein